MSLTTLAARVCDVEDCERAYYCKGYCERHYRRQYEHGDPAAGRRLHGEMGLCRVADCNVKAVSRDLCKRHYARWRRHGDPCGGGPRIAPQGSGTTSASGYRIVVSHGHPNADARGYIKEHTLVMSRVLGRPLREGETVHHRNGVRDDNRPENLELMLRSSHPSGQRVIDLVEWAHEVLRLYGPDEDTLLSMREVR